jgi:hypothetical protein
MLFDNENYTERQREIIKKIGKERRETINKEKKKVVLTYCGVILFMIALGTFLGIKADNIALIILTILMSIAIFGLNISKKNNQLDELKNQDDYQIGLFFGDVDNKVKGNAYKKYKQVRLVCIFITICSLV